MEKRTSFTLFFAIFAAILGLSIISPILPTIAEDLRVTGVWMGLIFSGFAISRAIVIGSFIGTIIFIVPLCNDFITLLLVNVVVGIGTAMSIAVATDIAVVIGRKVGMGFFLDGYI